MRRVTRATHILQALFTAYYAHMLEYRAELLFWALSGTLPLIVMGIWMQAASGGNLGLTPLDFARYFLAAFVTRQLTVVWVIWELEKEVVQGRLSPRLLQPLDPGWHHFMSHVAERFARLPLVAILVALFFGIYPQAFWVPSGAAIAQFLLTCALVFGLRFLMQYTFGMLSFWTERASAIEQFWFLVYLFLSGMVAPLEVFPPAVRAVVMWLPFPYLVHFPAAIAAGLPVNVGQGFGAIGLWALVFGIANRWLWRKGLRHYSGMGA